MNPDRRDSLRLFETIRPNDAYGFFLHLQQGRGGRSSVIAEVTMKIIPAVIFTLICLVSSLYAASLPDKVKGLYVPASGFEERRIKEIVYYSKLAGMNTAVLHVKDPFGRIYWKSLNSRAISAAAVYGGSSLENALKILTQSNFWKIAKVDVFADHKLVTKYPEKGIRRVDGKGPWKDKNGLYWANPCDEDVWDYIIALCTELVWMGFDEIQFDYVRFPSDGKLGDLLSPERECEKSKSQCISGFLETAYNRLKPEGVVISVDVFGLTAWKTDDFGIGQILEDFSPFVDVICPMLYPSHFPYGFKGWGDPSRYPEKIMMLSVKNLSRRTDKPVRPWVQGFWYPREAINSQIDGIEKAGLESWAVWNARGRYTTTFKALEARMDTVFPEPVFYLPVDALKESEPRKVMGNKVLVHYTDYEKGFSMYCLESPQKNGSSAYNNPAKVLKLFDEAVMDRILAKRKVRFSRKESRSSKIMKLARLAASDLGVPVTKMRPVPVYISWDGPCRFRRSIPGNHMKLYLAAQNGKKLSMADSVEKSGGQ